jgi:polygalacturonase
MKCTGSTHGLSVTGVGADIHNVLFQDTHLENSMTGARLKTVYGDTGSISNITWQNIVLSGTTLYGIDVQQDYKNGGPTGNPTNGYKLSGITFRGITGTVASKAIPIYILCGQGSCSDITLDNVSLTGGKPNSCNIAVSGC